MSGLRKIVIAILALLAILIFVAVVVVPRLVDVDRYRPQVISRLERTTGRKAEIGRLSLRLLPVLSIRVDNFALDNPAGFPAGRFLAIERVYAELDAAALLHREIVIGSLKLEGPVVNLVSNAQGRWNSENPAAARVRNTAWQSASPAPSIEINKVELEHGRVTLTALPASGVAGPPNFEAGEVSVDLEDVNPSALGVTLTSGGGAPARGASTYRPAILTVAEFMNPGERGEAEVRPLGPLAAHGTFTAQSARFGALAASRVKSGIELYGGGVTLNGLTLNLCGGQAAGDLVWNSAARPAARYTAKLGLNKIDVTQLLAAFPKARGRMTGTLGGTFNLTGSMTPSSDPLGGKEGTGQLTVVNGRLPTLQLNRNLMMLIKDLVHTAPASGDPSSFRSISADLELGGGELRSHRIVILGNGIDLDASGTLTAAGAGQLNYQGVAKVEAGTSGVTNILAGLLGSKIQGGKLNFPFTLTGTLDAPRFALKAGRRLLP